MGVCDEQSCVEICDELTEMEGKRIEIIRQVGGHIEITGVYRRFFGWEDALEYLLEMLEVAKYVQSLKRRLPYAHYGTKAPKKTQGSKTD